jgi:hypothetical protein
MSPSLLKRGPMRRRLHILRRRREAMLLDLGALVLEMHRHGRFLPDGVARRAAEAVGTDAELRALSRALEAGDGNPDLVAAGVAGNCPDCGALHTLGASFCSQCGAKLENTTMPRKAALGQDPELMPEAATLPRRPLPAPVPAPPPVTPAAEAKTEQVTSETAVVEPEPEPEPDPEPETEDKPETKPEEEPKRDEAAKPAAAAAGAAAPMPASRARATRVRQRLNEPSKPRQNVPTGLITGIAAGVIVIGLGALILTSGGGDDGGGDSDRASEQAPAQNEPEPPPDDEPVTPLPEDNPPEEETVPGGALEPVEGVTAEAYDPAGDDEEHSEEASLAVDGDAATVWPTEEYDTGELQKEGVGLVLQPTEALPARALDLTTDTPGFDVTIYGAETELPDSIDAGWAEIASEEAVQKKGRITLDAAGNDFGYYLIWITKLPEDDTKVEIPEAQLLQ